MSDNKNKIEYLKFHHKMLTDSNITDEEIYKLLELLNKLKFKKTLMIAGSQGSGKSTLSILIKKYFKRYYSKSVVILSIDDFYKSSHQRKILAKKFKTNLFETRGVPGTHNLELLNQTIDKLKTNKFPIYLPVFDKVTDNKKNYKRIVNKVDLIILEGWCVGSKPIDPIYLNKNINDLEKKFDPSVIWREAYNNSLSEYQKLFKKFQIYIFIKIPNWRYVIDWKYKQELSLRSIRADIRLKKKLYQFIQYYEKLSKWMSKTSPNFCNILIKLDKKQKIKEIIYK